MARLHLSLKEVFIVQEISREESEHYYQDILRRDPDLHDQLERVAQFALMASRSETKTPSDVSKTLRVLFNQNKDIDPLQSGDTMGVEMYIDHLADEDPETAGKAKRFYNNVFNALLKNRYDKG